MKNIGVMPLISTSFAIEGDNLDPNEFTSTCNIEPTGTGIKGRARPGWRCPSPTSYWWLVRKSRSCSIGDELAIVLSLIWPHRAEIVEFVKFHNVEAVFTTGVTIYRVRPIYILHPEVLEKLAYFNTEYIIDIFDFSEE